MWHKCCTIFSLYFKEFLAPSLTCKSSALRINSKFGGTMFTVFLCRKVEMIEELFSQ